MGDWAGQLFNLIDDNSRKITAFVISWWWLILIGLVTIAVAYALNLGKLIGIQ
jgi:hypothetical protein